jgi:hypothetical protein
MIFEKALELAHYILHKSLSTGQLFDVNVGISSI